MTETLTVFIHKDASGPAAAMFNATVQDEMNLETCQLAY